MKILISLVNYNSRDYILNCLKDLFGQKISPSDEYQVVVFDNNSPDKSADLIKEKFPKIKLVKNDQNLGFGKAHNKVAEMFLNSFDAMLLVNPDTRFSPTVLDQITKFISKQSNCGVVSGKIVRFNGERDSNGGDFPLGAALFNWLFNLEMFRLKKNFHRVDKEYYQQSHAVDWVGGTFMFIRKEVIKKVGLFDKDFFMYFEDVEFCYRVKKGGFKVMMNPEIEIHHASGASTNNPHFFQWSNEYNNLILFYQKNFGIFNAFWVKMIVYISILLRIVTFGLLGKKQIAWTYLKVLRSIG